MKRRAAPEEPDDDGGPLYARARSTDPDTSHAAAASVKNLSPLRRIILETLRAHGPMIDYHLIDRISAAGHKYTRSGIQTRRNELVSMGLVRDSKKRADTYTGRAAIQWEAVP